MEVHLSLVLIPMRYIQNKYYWVFLAIFKICGRYSLRGLSAPPGWSSPDCKGIQLVQHHQNPDSQTARQLDTWKLSENAWNRSKPSEDCLEDAPSVTKKSELCAPRTITANYFITQMYIILVPFYSARCNFQESIWDHPLTCTNRDHAFLIVFNVFLRVNNVHIFTLFSIYSNSNSNSAFF